MTFPMKKTIITFLLLLPAVVQAQEVTDTLNAAIKTGDRRVSRRIGELGTDLAGIRAVVSPLGEGDPIRWIQRLPGVTTGADGGSAVYVRGGNMGNNLFSIDGIQIYGQSHLLGLTTVVPQSVIGNVSLLKGGFDGSAGNFTSSQIRVETKTPGLSKTRVGATVNNFLLGAEADIPVSDKLSLMFSGRVSPMTLEYRALKGLMQSSLGDLKDFRAGVGDVYAKLHWNVSPRHRLELSGLGSIDHYSFSTPSGADDAMGWKNAIAILRYRGRLDRSRLEATASYNHYGNSRDQKTVFRGMPSRLSLTSAIREANAFLSWKRPIGKHFDIAAGGQFRYAFFAPGRVASVTNEAETSLGSVYVSGGINIPDKLSAKAAVRGNAFHNAKYRGLRIDPEFSLSAKWDVTSHFAVEASYDRTVQYYHTLEGLPVGWSLDLIVPSGDKVSPESAEQLNAGVSFVLGGHSLSLGAFGKEMSNLVLYKEAQTMFSGGLAAWEDNVDIGRGKAYGAELLYEYRGRDFGARVAYTLSRTTREGFASMNDGKPFNARFDRRHVLNASAQWRGFSAAFTAQSGHWENGAAETYTMHIPGQEWTADYFATINNYKMPAVVRLDVGYAFSFKSGRVGHDINVGICNVLNRFNPFMLYFDTSTESWKELALLPFFPNISYRISF